MSEKKISIRIGVADGDKARKELHLTGEAGAKAMRRIKEATAPASKSLTAINVVAEQSHFAMMHLAGGVGTLGMSLSRLGPIGIGVAASLGGISMAMRHGLKEFMETEHALNRLNAALRSTDFASGVTSESIMELGEALERNTLFKKEDVLRAAANLTSFGNIHGKVFNEALKISANLAVRLGTDLPTAADMLARVLERPENGLGRLAGKFSDLSFAQRESMENFRKQGNEAAALTIMIDHLKSSIGGLAEAQATGLTGATNALSDAVGNLLQSLVKISSVSKLVEAGFGAITYAVREMRKELDPTLLEREKMLEDKIERQRNSVAGKFVNKGTDSPDILSLKAELVKVKAERAEQKKRHEEADALASDKSDKASAKRSNDKLLELQKKYREQRIDLASSPQQKILTEHAERRQEIAGMGKQGASQESMQGAYGSLQQATTLKLASTPGVPHTGEQTREYYEAQKKALDEWRANLESNIDGAKGKNEEYAAQIEQIYNTRLREIYANSLANSTDWSDGAQRAMLNYSESAMNAAANAEKVFGTAAHKAEDLLTNAVMKGKLSFDSLKDFALSTIEDITRAMVRQSITGPLMGMLGGAMGGGMFGIFHEGGVVGESKVPHRFLPGGLPGMPDFSNIPRLHSGLAPDEFPAILQRGETVLPRNAGYKAGHGHGHSDAPINIVFNISTPNVQSFTESRGQIMATFAGEIDRYRKRNR